MINVEGHAARSYSGVDGKHNNNNASNKKARSKSATRNANINANILIIEHR